MSLRRYRYVVFFAVAILFAATHAHAITLTLAGPEPESAGPATDLTSTIWAGMPDGPFVRIATVGDKAPAGGTFTDMGVPSITPDSQVIFGAQTTDVDGAARWEIFRGDPAAPADRRVTRAMESASVSRGCIPKLKLDPYPVAGSDGSIAFIAPEAAGSDVLFRYSQGELTCAVRIGDRTAEGHAIRMLDFGSAAMTPSGEVAFKARIDDADNRHHRSAHRSGSHLAMIIAAPHEPPREVAVEGSREPGGARYLGSFGIPAAVSTTHGVMIAFAAMTSRGSRYSHGYGLYVYRGGKTVEVLASGDRTSLGRITYLSNGRPALSANGNIAVRGASADRRAIVAIRDGRPTVVLTPGQATEFGSPIVNFADPVVSASGLIMVGVDDEDGRNLLYAVHPDSVRRISMPEAPDGDLVGGVAASIFAGTLVVNDGGAFAFLGGKQ